MTITSILAFDFGTKNIGVAYGQTITRSTSELESLKASDGIPNWSELEKLISEWKPEIVLVGLPLNMDGSESELSIRARKFANRIHGRFGVAIEMVDERLSTREAKSEAIDRGHKGNYAKRPIDSIAARLILDGWLHEMSSH
jgi:putative Holliday junction resolvase